LSKTGVTLRGRTLHVPCQGLVHANRLARCPLRWTPWTARQPRFLVKTVMDAASILRDDAQLVELHAGKRYAVDRLPRWEITVESIGDAPRTPLVG
jgi:hypothetical protein